jgi:hypothetical protein
MAPPKREGGCLLCTFISSLDAGYRTWKV